MTGTIPAVKDKLDALTKVSEGVYKMHGLLYEDETLEFDAKDEEGNLGIRVGPMFLERR
jgi:hypothetical protein